MNNLNRAIKIQLSPLRLHSASSIQVPKNGIAFLKSKPYVQLSPLNLHSATSVQIPTHNSTNIFNNRLAVSLTPLRSPVVRKYKVPPLFRVQLNLRKLSRRVFPSITKCNAKRCSCCNYLSCKSHIQSVVNGRRFNVNLPSDID